MTLFKSLTRISLRWQKRLGPAFAHAARMASLPDSHVLVVEDEQCIRDILFELFDVRGVCVHVAATLAEAKGILGERSVQLIVTDIRLGGRRDGGLQVMAAAGLLSPDAPIIALTAFPDDGNREACLRLGATHFLEKPVSLETLAQLAAGAGVPTAMLPGVQPPAEHMA